MVEGFLPSPIVSFLDTNVRSAAGRRTTSVARHFFGADVDKGIIYGG